MVTLKNLQYFATSETMISPISSFLILFIQSSLLIKPTLQTSIELTFELADKDEACFFEDVEENVQIVFEFEVASGGKKDIDCSVTDPKERVIFEAKKETVVSTDFLTAIGGTYKFCFANKFSTFTHKVVYFQLEVGDDDEDDLFGTDGATHREVFSASEAQLHAIHEKLKVVIDHQTHHRLKEVSERKFSEDLRDRVQLWSLLQFSIMIAVSLLQVMIVRSFFSAHGKRQGVKP